MDFVSYLMRTKLDSKSNGFLKETKIDRLIRLNNCSNHQYDANWSLYKQSKVILIRDFYPKFRMKIDLKDLKGDGSCIFRSVAQEVTVSQEDHIEKYLSHHLWLADLATWKHHKQWKTTCKQQRWIVLATDHACKKSKYMPCTDNFLAIIIL